MEILQFGSNIQQEKGTWAAAIGGSSGNGSGHSYTIQTGRYIKTGSQVFIAWNLAGSIASAPGGTVPSGAIRIINLPFAPIGDPNFYWNNLAFSCNIQAEGIAGIPLWFIRGNLNAIALGLGDNNLNANPLTNQLNWSYRGGTSFDFRGQLIYETA